MMGMSLLYPELREYCLSLIDTPSFLKRQQVIEVGLENKDFPPPWEA